MRFHKLLLPGFCLLLGCSDEKVAKNQPVSRSKQVEARIEMVDRWQHGKTGIVQVCFETTHLLSRSPVRLDCSDLPADFMPKLYVTFLKESESLGEKREVPFELDC